MRTRMSWILVTLTTLVVSVPARAQSSASHQVEGATLNAGGRPSGGMIAQSPSHRITLDVVGADLPGVDASSAGFRLTGGFGGTYAPPSEVQAAAFTGGGPTPALTWAPMPAAGVYDVYRGATGTLPGAFGSCLAANVTTTSYTDFAAPASRAGFFYLVTGENRLGEEGTKGSQSNGPPRTSSPACP